MFAVAIPEILHPKLAEYVKTPFVKSFKLVRKKKKRPKFEFEYGGKTFSAPGIHYTLRTKFYPKYIHSRTRRKGRQKKGSSKKIGISVMSNLLKYVKTGVRPRAWMPKQIIEYIEDTLEHTFQAVELPIYILELECATQIDLITADANGKLYVWEIKTGFPVCKRKPGNLTWFTSVKNTPFNHWELQRHYCAIGLSNAIKCFKTQNSRVLHVYEEVKGASTRIKHVKARKIPTWAKKI